MSSATLSDLLDALERGERFLLPNARAARALRASFDGRQRTKGLAAWEPPQVLSWSQWTSSQWSELIVTGAEDRLLLNAAQELSVWREILAEDPENNSFGSTDSLAELARSAWQLAAGYNATHRLREFAVTHDSSTFARWAEQFSRRCASRGYLSVALLDSALLQQIHAGALDVPKSIQMVGFGALQPAQELLLAALRDRGVEVKRRTLEATSGEESLRAFSLAGHAREELLLAARWIRGYLEEQNAAGHDARVAVLVPGLAEERAVLEDVFREILAPELQSIEADLSSTPWEFSGGVPLSSVAMIGDFLALARWAEGPLPVAQVSSLLLSPYVGTNGVGSDALNVVARFDVNKLRRALLLRPEIEISAVVELAEGGGTGPLDWLQAVWMFLRRSGDRSKPRSYAEWMELVRGLARAANWPGERAMTATEFAATSAWESTLDLVSTMDFSGRRVSWMTALQALELQARNAVFAPPSTGAPVQVMQVAEAEGSIFDAVVFVHVTDANWPAAERVNPLLSWALQRALKMPGSDPSLAAAKSRAYTDDLLKRSGSVLFLYAAEDDNGALRPSPLLAELGLQRIDAAMLVAPVRTVDAVPVERVADEGALPPLQSHEVKGGATVLKLQAACGFLAFAQMRLHATEPRSGGLGIDALESGNLLHRALQSFWTEVKTQEALGQMRDAERDALLTRVVEEAFSRKLHAQNEWDQAYLAVQKERLRSVLRRWLELELKRGPFTVIAVEKDEKVTVGPLTLDVRMDRIDKVGDGVFFVDYKTGYGADPKQWAGERPEEPQLPLYTLLPEAQELKGVAFAKVRTGRDMKWAGYAAEEGILPASRGKGSLRDFETLVDEWRAALTVLAEDFAEGKADVRPKSFDVNCVRCGQRLLCRIDPALLMDAEDGDEAHEEDIDG